LVVRLFVRLAAAILFAIAAMLPGMAQAAAPTRQPTPSFVIPVAVPAPRPARLRQVQDGTYTLLYDTQILDTGTTTLTYRRQVDKVTSREGLEKASKTSIDFDPYRETLAINAIHIIRGKQVIDALGSASIDTIRRESSADEDIWTGVMTSVIQVRDLRVGDVIDVSWTWTDRQIDWVGNVFASFDIGWSVPVGMTHARLVREGGAPLYVRPHAGAPAPVISRQGGRIIYDWSRADGDPVQDDDDRPKWFSPWATVEVSTMHNWGDVVNWALPLYQDPGPMPADLAARVAAIAARTPDPARRTVLAMRVVQDDIRYNSLSMGAGSYQPRQIGEVWRSGFGDCKDKARLLAVILGKLGVQAWPALTDSDQGGGLAARLPAPTVFDHVIVLARIAGHDYWLDATKSLQGGALADLADLPYRWALPIRAGQKALAAVPWRPSLNPTEQAVETYRFAPDGLTIDVATTYRQDEADIFREHLSSSSEDTIEKNYLDYYRGRYPGVESVMPLKIVDDRDRNLITTRERYRLGAEALKDDDLRLEFPIEAATMNGLFKRPDKSKRQAPLTIDFPINRTDRIVLITPDVRLTPPNETSIDGPGFRYTLQTQRNGDTLVIDTSLFGKSPEIDPGQIMQYRADAKALAGASAWYLNLDGDPASHWLALLIVLVVSGIVLIGFGVWKARREGQIWRPDQQLYPVPLSKWLIMSIATMGLYERYWQYRCWAQVRHADGSRISPLWRTLFAVFWVWPLFVRANRDVQPPIARWKGIVAAVGYPLWAIGITIIFRLLHLKGGGALAMLGPLFLVPVVQTVNRANQPAQVWGNGGYPWFAVFAAFNGIAIEGLLIYFGR
jgi:transglutaminase-like putative cysteine protease